MNRIRNWMNRIRNLMRKLWNWNHLLNQNVLFYNIEILLMIKCQSLIQNPKFSLCLNLKLIKAQQLYLQLTTAVKTLAFLVRIKIGHVWIVFRNQIIGYFTKQNRYWIIKWRLYKV